MNLFSLEVEIAVDDSGFIKSVAEVRRKMDELGQGVSQETDKMSSKAVAAGNVMSNAFSKALSVIKQVATESISLASDLTEVQNVVDVTFGDSATIINAWAKTAQSAFGMNELKAKQFSSTMGAMLKSMGLTGDETLEMAQNLTELAGDMASFYNLDHEEVFAKIRSGISGETEPLKQLGINMSVANLEAYALSQGITTAYNSMTQAQQATLRYSYLLNSTKDAQGDYARTSNTFANAIKTLEENFNSLKISLGESLIDVVTPAINLVNGLFETDAYKAALEATKKKEEDETSTAEQTFAQADYLIDQLASGNLAEGTAEWESALKALVQVMPELGSYIDTNTGKLSVSTEQLRKNAEAVRDLAIYDAKQSAISSYNKTASDAARAQAEKQVELWVEQSRREAYETQISNLVASIRETTGFEIPANADDLWTYYNEYYDVLADAGVSGTILSTLQGKLEELDITEAQIETLKNELLKLAEAEQAAAEEAENVQLALDGFVGDTQESAIAARDYYNAMDDQISALDAVVSKVNELDSAYTELKKSARESIESMMKGFATMDMDSRTQLTGGKNADDSLENSLQNQTAYMEQYTANLQLAMTKGLDDEFVAQLADGSEDSAAILRSLAIASDDEIAAIQQAWEDNQAVMDEMAEAMATAKGKVDENVQTIKDDLVELVEAANQKDTARTNITLTMDAINSTITEKESELRKKVAEVNAILALLGAVSYTMGTTDSAAEGPTLPTIGLYGPLANNFPGSNAKGLGYVPYDDYLTYLHKGEAVLNRSEADRYRAGQATAPASIDYDQLAAAMAGVMDGAIVQMDGQTVGQLVAPAVSRAIQQEARAGRYAT